MRMILTRMELWTLAVALVLPGAGCRHKAKHQVTQPSKQARSTVAPEGAEQNGATTSVTVEPSDVVVLEGSPAVLSVVSDKASLPIRWQRNGEDLAGQTNRLLRFDAVTEVNVGFYTCVSGGITSAPVTLFSVVTNATGTGGTIVKGPLKKTSGTNSKCGSYVAKVVFKSTTTTTKWFLKRPKATQGSIADLSTYATMVEYLAGDGSDHGCQPETASFSITYDLYTFTTYFPTVAPPEGTIIKLAIEGFYP